MKNKMTINEVAEDVVYLMNEIKAKA